MAYKNSKQHARKNKRNQEEKNEYAIIEFEDGEADVVPRNWINEGICRFPNYKLSGSIRKAKLKREEPKSDWQTCSITRSPKIYGKLQ